MKFNFLLSLLISMMFIRNSSSIRLRRAVVVGGGPAGLTTALMLQQRGWVVTVLERLNSYSNDERTQRSYQYMLDARGQHILNETGVLSLVRPTSVSIRDKMGFTEMRTSGETISRDVSTMADLTVERLWLSRGQLLTVLEQRIRQINSALPAGSLPIDLLFGAECVDVRFNSTTSTELQVVCKDKSVLPADLVVACDGIRSAVRESLVTQPQFTGNFSVTKLPSPAAGLRFKMLGLNRDCLPVPSSSALAVRSTGKTTRDRLSLGFLPVTEGSRRTANIICRPEHIVWSFRTVEELSDFLKRSFPQLQPLDKYFSDEEIAAFLGAATGEFPQPQYVNTLTAVSSSAGDRDGGVVLIGDAAHAFPPDLGQGVNSALEDVAVLGRCLDSSEGPQQVSLALKEFQSQRIADVKALCSLVSFAYPFQYNQDLLRKILWQLNMGLRLLLSRLLPRVFHPPATLMVGDSKLSYSEVLRRAHLTTQRLKLLGMTLVLPIAVQIVRCLLPLWNNFIIKMLFSKY